MERQILCAGAELGVFDLLSVAVIEGITT